MTSLVEQTVRVLSGSRPYVQEKSLSDSEIEDLIDKGKEVTAAIARDSKKSDEEREMFWIGLEMFGRLGTRITHFIQMLL